MVDVTCIYGLCDPRVPHIVMYVGKGLEKRAQHHWKYFLNQGKAVNTPLRRWFERLRTDGIKPIWCLLEENVLDWEAAERAWIAFWRIFNRGLCNIANGGNYPNISAEEKIEIGRRSGIIQGKINASKPGFLSSLGFKFGHLGGKRTKELHAEAQRKWCKQSKETCSKAGKIGGPSCAHLRWHARRGIVSPTCKLCQEML
jgi:hypothetical protein